MSSDNEPTKTLGQINTAAEEPTKTLGQLYTSAEELWYKIENTTLESNSEELEEQIERCICCYEHLSLMVSQVSLFSNNETIDEIPTSSIKFLLLPCRLGNLTLKKRYIQPPSSQNGAKTDQGKLNVEAGAAKLIKPDRSTVLKVAKIYLHDFLIRCKQYELTTFEITNDTEIKEQKEPQRSNGKPTPAELQRMGQQRNVFIEQMMEKRKLEGELKILKSRLDEADEEVLRTYHTTEVALEIMLSMQQLQSIKMEESMLQRHASKSLEGAVAAKPKPVTPLRTFMITRDAAQKEVYGMGYPSLPIMSVDEFYEKRVREGWWPPASRDGPAAPQAIVAEHGMVDPEDAIDPEVAKAEDINDVDRESLIARDDYRDVHRTGWGNTYNRS